jgi:hypothetical protein
MPIRRAAQMSACTGSGARRRYCRHNPNGRMRRSTFEPAACWRRNHTSSVMEESPIGSRLVNGSPYCTPIVLPQYDASSRS